MKKEKSSLAELYTIDGANEGFDVNICKPGSNIKTGLIINVLGKDSDEFQKVSRAQNKKRMSKIGRGGFRGLGSMASPEEIDRDSIELLARCTKSWTFNGKNSIPGPDGNELDFNFDNVVLFYTASPDAREQVDTEMGDRANFIKT
jgi:hypothetical protein